MEDRLLAMTLVSRWRRRTAIGFGIALILVIVVGSIAGWFWLVIALAVIALLVCVGVVFSAARQLDDAIVEETVLAARDFELNLDRSMWPTLENLFNRAIRESARTGEPLTQAYRRTVVSYLEANGYPRWHVPPP